MARAMMAVLLICLALAPTTGWTEVLYGADGAQGNSSNLYIIDPATGAVLRTVGPIGFAITGLAIHPTRGELYGSTSNRSANAPGSLIRIDKATGAGTLIGSFGFPSGCGTTGQTMADLTFASDGTLYGWLMACSDALHTVNLDTGQATKVGESGLEGDTVGAGLAASAANVLFFAGAGDDGPLRTINRTTGVATGGAFLNGDTGDAIGALAFSQSGTLYGAQLALPEDSIPVKAFLVAINTATGNVTTIGQTVDRLDAIVFDPSGTPPPSDMALFASALPLTRAVAVGETATFFATMIVTGTGVATGCRIEPATPIPADFLFQTTNASNQLVGSPDVAPSIAGGSLQTFLIAFEPIASFGPTEVELNFTCNGTGPAAVIPGVNTVIVSSTGGPDVVALAVTASNDGILTIPGATGIGAFAVATVNLGAAGSITASANTTGPLTAGPGGLPVSISLCRTDAQGACITALQPSVTTPMGENEPATFSVFVTGQGVVPFDPASNRIFVLFSEGATLRGATSVAVRTQ